MKVSIRQIIAKRILEREKLRQACGIKTCKTCHGSGFIMGKRNKKCLDCEGTGKDQSNDSQA